MSAVFPLSPASLKRRGKEIFAKEIQCMTSTSPWLTGNAMVAADWE